ncbi:MAG: hypothetical protein ABIP55_13975 [Tepidisphaeraceae bacterium]
MRGTTLYLSSSAFHPGSWVRKSRFSKAQIVAIVRESERERSTVAQVAKKHCHRRWFRSEIASGSCNNKSFKMTPLRDAA